MKLLLLFFAALQADAFFLPWRFGRGTVGTPSPDQLRRFTPPPLLEAYVAKLSHRSHQSLESLEDNRRTASPDGDDNRRTMQPAVILSRAPSDLSQNRRTPPPPVDLHGRTPSIRFSRPPPAEDNRGHTMEPIAIRSRAPSDLNRRTTPPADDLSKGRTMSPDEDVLLSRAPSDLNKNRRTPPPTVDESYGRTASFRFSHPPAEDRFTHGALPSRSPDVILSRAPAFDGIRRRTTASGDAEPPLEVRRHSIPYNLPTQSPTDTDNLVHRRSTPGDLPPAVDCEDGSTASTPSN